MSLQFQLIGYPIQHSLSPWIHERFLSKANLQGTYEINEIEPQHSFEEKIMEMKNNKELNGFNVTVPYKQKIIPYLDSLDKNAKTLGAVNTVLNKDGKWIGYNTDSIGYVRALETKYPELTKERKSKHVLILGAGGAARGIYCGLDFAGYVNIDIANRTTEKAREIAELRSELTNTDILTLKEAENNLLKYDIIIQTTSVGMKPNTENTIIHLKSIKKDVIVSDIVYQPIKTKFLKEAENLGARIHYGHTMLLYQGLYAFEIWTGLSVDINNMDEELQQVLEGR
ncbi:shikimate dehydrogenase [Bacilli bacterium]|uniref:shikimate dehydrogenase n=1 Tax=Oceanobacillus TaxID=182709 RepID=UPI0006222D18|nr:shikimate dehydrogenase [Bacilli bacterium VT-13-104]PZD87862.1 shikimate dehydrogenase [Bacilli bacterium]PZD89016.1 shikimate dehydrogenase [Bacilli bacterium]PZD92444.1 shikimate dehydrogenase [Bacilli bacterium]RCO07290.1 shikimate dehydrogenase [Bacilli bacterium]